MNSIHDMGGMHGFGRVEIEANEPVFHESWEGRVFAMQRAMGVLEFWTIDMARASLEALPPETYVRATYYQRWLLGLEHRVLGHDLVGTDEIEAGHSLRPGEAPRRIFKPEDADKIDARKFRQDRVVATPVRSWGPGEGHAISTPRHIRACLATPATSKARLKLFAAATFIRTP